MPTDTTIERTPNRTATDTERHEELSGQQDHQPTRDFTKLPLHRRAGWVILLGSLAAVGAFTVDLYLPAFPLMRRQLHASAGMVQLTLTGMMVGLAVGQLVVGPLADALGRRRPLLAGLLVHAGASVGCAVAPSIGVLAVLRICQGLGVAAASVIALAMVRDRFDGTGTTRLIARLMLIIGASPIFAPSIGGFLVSVTGWRGIFLVLAGISLTLAVISYRVSPETLPAERRRGTGLRATVGSYRHVLADRPTAWLVAVAGLSQAALFGYVAASSFVYQQQFGLSDHVYGLIFAAGGCCLIAGSQLSGSLVHRYPPRRLLTISLVLGSISAAVLLATSATGAFGMAGVAVPTCAVLGAFGLGQPAAPAIALGRHGDAAGTTAALLGGLRFAFAAVAAPAVTLFAVPPALGMALVIGAAMVAALALYLMQVRRRIA